MTRRCDAFSTVSEVLTLEISDLSPGGRGPLVLILELFQPHLHSCCPDSSFIAHSLSIVMSGWRSDVKGSERVGRKHPFLLFALRRRGLDRSGDASESLYLCNIFAV